MSLKKLASRMLTTSFLGTKLANRKPSKSKLQMLHLEDRTTPAVFFVNPGDSINDAIALAAATPETNDQIQIATGIYTEDVVVNTPVTLVGVGGPVVIQATSSSSDVIKVLSNDVTLTGLAIFGGRYGITNIPGYSGYPDGRGALNNLVISANTISGQQGDGITLDYDFATGTGGVIAGNNIFNYGQSSGTWAGIALLNGASAYVNGNTISDTVGGNQGIFVESNLTSFDIANNNITTSTNSTGIALNIIQNGSTITLFSNTISAAAASTGAIGVSINSVFDGAVVNADANTVNGSGTFDVGINIWNSVVNITNGAIGSSNWGVVVEAENVFGIATYGSDVTISGVNPSLKLFGTTVADTFQVNTAAAGGASLATFGTNNTVSFAGVTNVRLDGDGGADTYNIAIANGPAGATYSVVDTGVSGTDTVNVFGTSGADSFDINKTTAKTVALGFLKVTYTSAIEQLTVAGDDGGDSFAFALDNSTPVTISGGNPVANPGGDSIAPDFTGLVGQSYNPGPSGSLSATGKATATWTGIETFPIVSGTATRFDFNGSPLDNTVGFTSILNTNLYNPTLGYGWKAAVSQFVRSAASIPAAVSPNALYRDGGWSNTTVPGVFQVAVTPGGTAAARVYIGDSNQAWNGIQVTIEGAAPIAVDTKTTPYGYYQALGTDVNNDGILDITIGLTPAALAAPVSTTNQKTWVANGVDVADSLANLPSVVLPGLTVTPAPSTITADGKSTSIITISGATPGATVTVGLAAGSAGKLSTTTPVANASGIATVTLTSPLSLAAGSATINATDSMSSFTGSGVVNYTATQVLRFDFNTATSNTAAGFVGVTGGVLASTVVATPTSADYGWDATTSTFLRGTSGTKTTTDFYRDGAWGNGGAAGARTFRVKLPTAGGAYVARLYIGDYTNYPTITVTPEGGAAALAPTPTTSYGNVTVSGFDSDNDGYAEITISNPTTSSYWVLNGLDFALTAPNLATALVPA